MVLLQAKVYREGELRQIAAKNLVPGDIIIIEEGDKIPADARLIEIKNFRTIEASLTGESFPVDKTLKPLQEKSALGDRKNMVWMGTFVAAGRAKAVVTGTGSNSAIGKLARSIELVKPRESHFRKKTDILAKNLALIAFGGAALTFIIGFFIRKISLPEISLFTMASLVSGIPEGLPAILAIVLAIGAFRMSRRKAVMRKKYATETLGIIDTIITDKTGTITTNTMTAEAVILPGQPIISITGTGWEPKGEFVQKERRIVPLENRHLDKFLHIVSLCNNAKLVYSKEKGYQIIGDPTEGALAVLSEKGGLKRTALKEKRIDDLPFNPELKYHASLSTLVEGRTKQIYIVGAPEAVIKNSTYILKNGRKAKLTIEDKKELTKSINSLTEKAMRVLAAAYKDAPSQLKDLSERDTNELILVGLVGMLDPPRKEVKESIAKARKAGIRVIMATGDHKNTAIAIANEIGLVSGKTKALTGAELEAMTSNDFRKAIKEVSVFARLTPETKLKIAKTLQDQGHMVAMTGDGVNDAPALKQADIGISMGIIGTDVARASSDMILTDDNFASIINAVEEGRTVFVNTRQTSFFLVTTSLGEDAAIIGTLVLGMPLPLLPTQILWLNLVTGVAADVALATERTHHDVLQEKPRKKEENILNKQIFPFIGLVTIIMIVLTIVVFGYYLSFDEMKARTAAFAVLTFTQLFNMYNLRSLNRSIFEIGPFTNKYVTWAFVISILLLLVAIYLPFMQGVFEFVPLSLSEMVIFFALSSSVLWAGELYKKFKKKKQQ